MERGDRAEGGEGGREGSADMIQAAIGIASMIAL